VTDLAMPPGDPVPTAPDVPPDAIGRRRSRTWFRGRSYAAGVHLEAFFVSAALGVIFNRVFLILTGYPQIGNATLHISHAIWGALAMMAALALYLAFLSPSLRGFISVLGGLGFGWFVDELGKFISRDVDYLFQPALSVIYCVFIGLFFWFRYLASRPPDADDAVLNALAALQSARLGVLTEADRDLALHRLDELADGTPLMREVRALLTTTAPSPPLPSSRIQRWGDDLRCRYEAWTERPSFVPLVATLFGVLAVAVVASVLADAFTRRGTTYSTWVGAGAAAVYTVLLVIGVVRLPRDRAVAFRWFNRAVLVWILVIQVFRFDRQQFGAVAGLLVGLGIWGLLRSAMAIEERRATQ